MKTALERMVEKAEQTNDLILGGMLIEHMNELQETFKWLVVSTKDRFDNEFGDGNYSPELRRAIEYLGI